jgi:TPR repeat protein
MRILNIILSLVCINAFAGFIPTAEEAKELRIKAESGDAEAQCDLGCYYKYSSNATKDYIEAVKWFRKSAEKGNAYAQYYLGICYAFGEGVMKDQVEAYAYYNIGGITNELARMNRDDLEKKMTASQIEAGVSRSKELQAEIEDMKKNKWWQIIK